MNRAMAWFTIQSIETVYLIFEAKPPTSKGADMYDRIKNIFVAMATFVFVAALTLSAPMGGQDLSAQESQPSSQPASKPASQPASKKKDDKKKDDKKDDDKKDEDEQSEE